MNLVLNTLKKDARHLWPALAASLGLLAILADANRRRADSIIGSTEGWLNLLLPLAWACVLALAILEEPLVGDRHFWLTRPHRWNTLLSAKFLFAALFVHLPLLLADGYVLIARGFSLFECLPQLFGKQVVLAVVVTLPAIALAALVGSFTQFIMLFFGVAAAAILVNGPLRTPLAFQRPAEYLRGDLLALIVAITAIAILVLQYRRRKLALARTSAAATAVLAGALLVYLPQSYGDRLYAALHPASILALRMEQRKQDTPVSMAPVTRRTVALTVALSGVPGGARYHIGPVDLTVSTPDGSRFRNTIRTLNNEDENVPLDAGVYRFPYYLESEPLNLLLRFDRALYEKLKDRKVRIAGQMSVSFYRIGDTVSMPMNGRVAAPSVGHCSSTIGQDRWSQSSVKVLCESPSHLPLAVATLAIPRIGREWQERLGGSYDKYNLILDPYVAWLSPLDRAKASFPVSDPRTRRDIYAMEVPLEYLDQAKIGVTPEIATGYTLVDFDFRDVSLPSYHVPPEGGR